MKQTTVNYPDGDMGLIMAWMPLGWTCIVPKLRMNPPTGDQRRKGRTERVIFANLSHPNPVRLPIARLSW